MRRASNCSTFAVDDQSRYCIVGMKDSGKMILGSFIFK